MRYIAYVLGALTLLAGGGAMAALATPPGGPHTPVTICHKPGTPAEQTLVVDDDAVPGHLGHGDQLGPCEPGETTPTDTTTTDTTTTTPVPPPPPTTTTTTTAPPAGHGCVYTGAGKDGQPGNDDCATTTTTTTTTTTAAPATTPPVAPAAVTTTTTATTPAPAAPPAKPAAKPKPVAAKPASTPRKPAKATPVPPKAPHVCLPLKDGTQRKWYGGSADMEPGCYPVVQGSG